MSEPDLKNYYERIYFYCFTSRFAFLHWFQFRAFDLCDLDCAWIM